MLLTFEHLISLMINIPQAVIMSFVQRHSCLKTLQLNTCGNANIQTYLFTNSLFHPTVELICLLSCIWAVMLDSIVKTLFTTYNGVSYYKFPMYKLLNLHQIGASTLLTILLLDFDNTIPQSLYHISVAALALCVFKLYKSKFSHKVYYIVHNPNWCENSTHPRVFRCHNTNPAGFIGSTWWFS